MNKKVMKLASPGKRFGAYCLDKVIPFILACVIVGIFAKLSMSSSWNNMYGYGFGYSFGNNYGGSGAGILGTAVSIFVVMAIAVAYIGIQVYFYTKSKTIGKAILGMQVVSSIDGQPVGVFKMILREWFAKKASGAIFLLGYLWIFIDDKSRGWHDKIMDTYVVDLIETAKYNKPESNETENNETEVQEVVQIETEGGTSVGE